MMSEDQRFAGRRPDVLSFQTAVLKEDFTLAGSIESELWVSTNRTAADWVVKVTNVYPGDESNRTLDGKPISMSHAQLLVRYEILRGRFRNSFEKPGPFQPNLVTKHLILCLLYAAGFRRSELTGIVVAGIDFTDGKIFVRSGKGDKDRYALIDSGTSCRSVSSSRGAITSRLSQEPNLSVRI